MAASIKFDQAGIPAGVGGKARDDGLDTGVKVFVRNDSGNPCICEFWWKPPDDGAAALSQNSPSEWEFTPTALRYGEYIVSMTEDAGTASETIQIKAFGIRLATSQLLIPGLNSRGDFEINLASSAPDKVTAAIIAYNNVTNPEGLDYLNWWQAQRELYEYVEGLGAGAVTTYLGLTDTPGSNVGQAGFIPTVNAGETAHIYEAWNRAAQGVIWDPDAVGDDPVTSVYNTWQSAFDAAMAHEGVQTIYMMSTTTGNVTWDVTGTNDAEGRLRLVHPNFNASGGTLAFAANAEIQNLLELLSPPDVNNRLAITTLKDLG